jgi:hypothetical protein
MAITPITNYEDRAESLVPEFLKRDPITGDKSFFVMELRAFAAQVQILENAAMGVYFYRGIDAALVYGAAHGFGNDSTQNPILDGIGNIVGQPRNLLTNVQYALTIKAKIQMNASRGEPERIISAAQAITTTPGNTPIKVNYFSQFPAGILLDLENPEIIPVSLQQIMESVVSGGVSIVISADYGNMFNFTSNDSSESDTSDTLGFNEDGDTFGGQLAEQLI